jgi:two-component sensor histidine kinase
VFQEMFANAVEHGSLGSGAGWLQVQWDVGEVSEGQVIVIDWRETGGPPPDANAVAGTGTVLIRGLIEGEMRGDIKLHHAPDGVSHRIRIPLKVMTHLHDV